MKFRRLALALLAAALGACGKGSSSRASGEAAGADRPKVAFLLSTLQEERYQKDKRFFETKARALGLEVISLAADNDNARQMAQVEDALTRGARVLVVQPTDSAAASAYVRMAHEHDAKVVAYDRAILSRDLDFYVSHDSHRVGVLQAEAALAATGHRGNYVLLEGQAGHSVANEITRGYMDTLRPYVDRGEVHIVAEQNHSAWSPEQALRTVEDAISKNGGNLQAILANNSGMARGAVQAVQSAHLANVFIAGADADVANVAFVCEGKQSVEVLKDIQPLAERAAEVAAQLARGERPHGDGTAPLGGGQVPMAAVRVALVTPDTVGSVVFQSGFIPRSALPSCARLASAGR